MPAAKRSIAAAAIAKRSRAAAVLLTEWSPRRGPHLLRVALVDITAAIVPNNRVKTWSYVSSPGYGGLAELDFFRRFLAAGPGQLSILGRVQVNTAMQKMLNSQRAYGYGTSQGWQFLTAGSDAGPMLSAARAGLAVFAR